MIIKRKKLNFVQMQYRAELEAEYKEKIRRIAEEIKAGSFITKKEQCRRLFDFFNQNIKYDYDILSGRREEGNFNTIYYQYKSGEISIGEKYAPILLKKGVCVSLSEAFKDICDLLAIPCRVIHSGDKEVFDKHFQTPGHAWCEVTIDFTTSTIDLDPHFLTFMGPRRATDKFEIKK